MKTVLILSNHHLYTYNLRKEVIQSLIEENYRVVIALPYGEKVELLKEMGCEFIDVPLDRRGTNPITDLRLFLEYNKILKEVKPDVVLTYTLKPNMYGGLACRVNKTNVIHTVTGLGSVFVRNVSYKKIIVFLNRIAFRAANMIAFMNSDNEYLYRDLKIISGDQKTMVVAGSGVNLDLFRYSTPHKTSKIKFTFIARVLKDKGIEEYLYAAKEIKKIYNNVEFEVVGFVDEEKYKKMLDEYEKMRLITYLGKRDDIPSIMANSSCIVLPSYGEGRGTVLQEGAAIGRPLITCNTYGCKDNVDDGYNGFLCEVADPKSLVDVMEKFINLSTEEKNLMGKRSREKAEKEFDRNIVVNSYLNEINKIVESG
ncbi:glycosyltransferase family 4 protein [Oceanobacillus senegalensis]|uniref:glycosyltransferase family 4 protein n=1 Tax=Oceanobacillus senegalensis TaxID=1936063 RepID=UPI000A31383C|nr:glycosyltransferase family 4 protein [Oceanobacillus senegalensis]